MSWFTKWATVKVQQQNARLIAHYVRLTSKNLELSKAAAALTDRCETAERAVERQAKQIHAITEENEVLRQRLRGVERLHPNALTDAQRQDAADEARYKRYLDGLGDR